MNGDTVRAKAKHIRLAVFDVDGVMTDGRLYLGDSGEELKAFHTRDGLGIKALMQNGIEVAVITARSSHIVDRRMAELGIEIVLQGREDKAAALDELVTGRALSSEQLCYAGDDLVDWPAMRRCGFKCAPADASHWIRERADLVTESRGGNGAVREICEFLLDAGNLLESWLGRFE